MAKKIKKQEVSNSSSKKRSAHKILDAFQIAERQENGIDEGSDGENDVDRGVMDARKFLKDGEGRGDDKFDDEEIDSDEALGSDDDYDILNSKFSQTIRDKKKLDKAKLRKKQLGQEPDSESSEDEYHSVDEGEFVSLSEAWALDDKDLKAEKGSKDVVLNDAWESESEKESEEDEDDDDEDDESGSDGEESDDEDIFEVSDSEVNLSTTVAHLKSQIKKPASARKRLVKETTEENEFGVPSNGALTLSEMMAAVDSSVTDSAILIDSHQTALASLAVPLPKRIQQKHDRKVAYEIAKEEVNKWQDVVQSNREADHLHFPMNEAPKPDTSTSAFKPKKDENELERKINALLTESSLLDDQKEQTFEEIAVAKLSPEEMRKRTLELRMMRELMFRNDTRARRIKKIKSKSFHKIQKKERLKNAELVESDESEDEDHDFKRAQERMTLKHKTQSQWAKSMIKSGMSKDASNRGELEEMLRQGERLRTKQLGFKEGDQSDDNVSDLEKEFANDNDEADDEKRSKLGKGVLAMDFMKKAEERRRQENIKELEFIRRVEEEDGSEQFKAENNSVNLTVNQGRRVYAPSVAASKDEMDELDQRIVDELGEDELNNLDNRMAGSLKDSIKEVSEDSDSESDSDSDSPADSPTDSLNPWLTVAPKQSSQKITTIDKTSSKFSKAAAKIAKKRSSSQREAEEGIINLDETLKIQKVDPESSDDEENMMFKQRDLIKQAFAGDDVVKDFNLEKKRIADEEDHKEEDITMPGWGSWAGDGTTKPKKKFVRKIEGVMSKDKRSDKDLKHVIINEKTNKKNLKYQSSGVPYPFESREQYERSLRMPLGQEWTSRATHEEMIAPRINVKQGVVIDPLKAPFK